jgi:Dolichyl-phosphate-mannose-protein mannosyltransferase
VAVEQTRTRPQPARAGEARPSNSRPRRALRRLTPEIAGYGVLALALAALLWSHVRDVDGFYLDEWIYIHGSQYIWENLPGGLVETIPEWTRGPQRLYSTVLALAWGPFSASTAYTLSHILNVVLLVSAIVPTALLARRTIDAPLLRVLAVALGVAVPWLMIASHQLTENLAFPLFLWALYATIRAAEEPSPARQAGALVAIAALTLCRLNLGFVFLAFFVAVLAAEFRRRRAERSVPWARWLRAALRREAIVILAAAAAVLLSVSGVVYLGAYGGVNLDTAVERLFGDVASETRRTMLMYSRALVVGGLVFPVAIGLGVGLAGAAGRAGPRLVIPSIVSLVAAAAVVVAVSVFTVGVAVEERYVFYAYTPIAVLAVAGVREAPRLLGWLAAGGALALTPLVAGYAASPSADSGHFFAAPAGAFWFRVVHHRLYGWEQDLLGWTSIGPNGWLLLALGLGAMLLFLWLARDRPRVTTTVMAGGLALCALGQVAMLDYGFKRELRGTPEVPGGIALSDDRAADRETWLDDRLPSGQRAAVMPGVPTFAEPMGGTERLQVWNKDLDATVDLRWYPAVTPVPPGYGIVLTQLGEDGLARWSSRPEWMAAHRDDPRVQFPAREVAGSPVSRYALYRTTPSDRALWTSTGLDADGAVLARKPVTMTLDRDPADGARAVTMTLLSVDGATKPVAWQVRREDGARAAGRLRPGQTRQVRLAVPSCEADGACRPVTWTLRASGRSVGIPIPAFGPPGPPRPVLLLMTSVRIAAER